MSNATEKPNSTTETLGSATESDQTTKLSTMSTTGATERLPLLYTTSNEVSSAEEHTTGTGSSSTTYSNGKKTNYASILQSNHT